MKRTILCTALLIAATSVSASPWTYRGTLNDGGKPAEGKYDLRLTLVDANQSLLGQTVMIYGADVVKGRFQTEVDFGVDLTTIPDVMLQTEIAQGQSGFFVVGSPKAINGGAAECWDVDGNTATSDYTLGITDSVRPILAITNNNSFLYLRGTGGIEQNLSQADGASAAAFNDSRASGPFSFAAGKGQTAPTHAYSFVFADNTPATFTTSAQNQFAVRADGGFLVNTTSGQIDQDIVFKSKPVSGSADLDMILRPRTGSATRFVVFDNNADLLIEPGAGGKTEIRSRLGLSRVAAANQLEVEGNASKSTAGSWLANSDRRIKTDIRPISGALGIISRINPVTFAYSDAYRAVHPEAAIGDGRYYNVIAQEFQNVFPNAVKGSGEYLPGLDRTKTNEILQVDTYPALITTIAAVQELNAHDDLVEQDLTGLRAENATLKARLDALEARLK